VDLVGEVEGRETKGEDAAKDAPRKSLWSRVIHYYVTVVTLWSHSCHTVVTLSF
jgi:hypothetical protein